MYTISDISKMTDFSGDTLRYYDRIGLLPFVKRNQWGTRYFTEEDLDSLATIRFMKDTGASTKEIRHVMQLIMKGDASLVERLAYYQALKIEMEAALIELQDNLKKVDWKIDYYQQAVKAGTADIHADKPGLYELYYKDTNKASKE